MYPRHILPGIGVEVPPAVDADALPRMDVALFVGFATRGPVHRPVAIDGVAAYRQVFGDDLILAHDPARGGEIKAALAPAVRGFFSNGGRRCWVIRTCRTAEVEARWRGTPSSADCASARTFTLPGIGTIRAASLGSWADGMKVSARIDRRASWPRFTLRAELGDTAVVSGPFGAAPTDPDSWWAQRDDDGYYVDEGAVAQGRALVAPTDAPATLDLLGLTDFWTTPVGPDADPRTPLERDGLSRFDEELFLDPALAGLGIATLSDAARRIRDIDGGTLAGIHGAFSVPGGADFAEPSLIAVPDAAQCGWDYRVPEAIEKPKLVLGDLPATWRDHAGSCAVPATTGTAIAPDTSRFLDCSTRVLKTPVFARPVQSPGRIDLAWSASEDRATYVLEESGRSDFAGAIEIWRGDTLAHSTLARLEGAYYFRVHAEKDGNVSAPSVVGVPVLSSRWTARGETTFDARPLVQVHRAMLRLCHAIGDQFALLSLPQHYRNKTAAIHSGALIETFVEGDARALSYGALYHPWLATPTGDVLVDTPPDGCIAGTFAARARSRGAWIAPANRALRDVVAMSPAFPDRDREKLTLARINVVRQSPEGFVGSDSLTLSPEYEWGQVNVRRLMNLLRRVAIRTGARFVFEPDGDVLRRAVERIFGHMLDDMVRRGAFAGKGAADSYRLAVTPSPRDRDDGRFIVEIAVCPSQPLRFLTLVLAQGGARFTVAEER